MDLDEAVAQLYGLHPDAFMAARGELTAQAKAERDTGLAKAIASIRKPTVAAWSVNQLVRRRPDDVQRLADLATAMHQAQEEMDGATLKRLGRDRSALIDATIRTTVEVAAEAGVSLSPAVVDQVRETFVAALASAPAADAVTSGQLTRALSYAGFGDVDLSEATAAPPAARRPALRVIRGEGNGGKGRDAGPEAAPPDEVAPAEPDPALLQRLSAAESRSRETMAAAAAAGQALSSATERLAALDERIAELERDLAAAKLERMSLVKTKAEASAANKVAERTLRASLAELDEARALLPGDVDDLDG